MVGWLEVKVHFTSSTLSCVKDFRAYSLVPRLMCMSLGTRLPCLAFCYLVKR